MKELISLLHLHVDERETSTGFFFHLCLFVLIMSVPFTSEEDVGAISHGPHPLVFGFCLAGLCILYEHRP